MRIKDICDINLSTISRKDKSKTIEYLDTSSITENVISDTQKLILSEAPSRAQRVVKNDTIIYSLVRPNLKHFGIIQDPPDNLIVSTGFCTLDIKDEWIGKIAPYYLFCFLSTDSITEHLSTIAANSVSSYPSINPSDIENIEVEFPSYEKQLLISEIFKEIDSKLANNRKQNAILEKMAKQIYDYWFVQFDFPDMNGKPYKSSGGKMVWNEILKREIPVGWEVNPIFDELDITYGYPFSTDLFTDVPSNKPLIRIRDILEGTISAYTTEEVSDKYRLQEGDVLVGMDGNFHMNYWHNNTTYLNQRCVRLRPRHDSNITSIQIFYGIQPYIKAKEKTTKGSTVGHLSDKDMKGLFILKANDNTQAYERKCELDNLLKKTISNRKEMLQLQSLRSYLLPLLMTGQAKLK